MLSCLIVQKTHYSEILNVSQSVGNTYSSREARVRKCHALTITASRRAEAKLCPLFTS